MFLRYLTKFVVLKCKMLSIILLDNHPNFNIHHDTISDSITVSVTEAGVIQLSFPGVKKSKKIHLSPGQVHQNFYLSCYQITCPCQGKNRLSVNFLVVRRILGENICLSCPGTRTSDFFTPDSFLENRHLYASLVLYPN